MVFARRALAATAATAALVAFLFCGTAVQAAVLRGEAAVTTGSYRLEAIELKRLAAGSLITTDHLENTGDALTGYYSRRGVTAATTGTLYETMANYFQSSRHVGRASSRARHGRGAGSGRHAQEDGGDQEDEQPGQGEHENEHEHKDPSPVPLPGALWLFASGLAFIHKRGRKS